MRRATLLLLAASQALIGCRDSRPDIVLVTLDTLRRDHVGAYGWNGPGSTPTPRLNALAKSSRMFESALTTMPTTSPAHASLFTGLAPQDHGVMSNGERVSEEIATRSVSRKLRDAGYRTAAFVTSSVFGPEVIGLGGFEIYEVKESRPGREAVADALAWLDRPREGAPAFLWVHLYDSHAPYGSAPDKVGHYPVDLLSYGWVESQRYQEPATRSGMAARYAAGVREADAAFGQLLDGLEARGMEPLLLVVADHGEFMAEHLDRIGFAYGHGAILGPEVLWLPLFVAGPGLEPKRVPGAVSIMDLYTTILAAAGVGDPAAGEGRVDLRGDPPAGRIVSATRRAYSSHDLAGRGIGAEAAEHIRAHAVAVSDGMDLVIVGEDGKPVDPAGVPQSPLVAAAAVIAATAPAGDVGDAPEIDPEIREKLRALGYVD